MRRMFRPEQDTWRMRSNQELDDLTGHDVIVSFIKSKRISWLQHVAKIAD